MAAERVMARSTSARRVVLAGAEKIVVAPKDWGRIAREAGQKKAGAR